MGLWYFAYGSNLSTKQMIERTGSIGQDGHHPRIARLADHRLVFQNLEKTGPAFANVLSPGDGVLGVIYRCSQEALEKLDRHEGGYERRSIVVTDAKGEELAAVAYFVTSSPAASFGRPSDEYLQKIVDGARHHGLPEPYIANILTLAASVSGQRGPSA